MLSAPRACVVALVAIGVLGCGGSPKPPQRRVFERDVDGWKFHRYQRVLDVEVYVPDNAAVGHTASYVDGRAEKLGRVEDGDVVNAFVTEYTRAEGVLRALAKFSRRLAQESGYNVEERKLGGERVIHVAGHGEAWALWSSKTFVVKVGGRGRETVPAGVVERYGDTYPSDLDRNILEGPLPAGPETKPPPDEPYDPNNPTPEWQQ